MNKRGLIILVMGLLAEWAPACSSEGHEAGPSGGASSDVGGLNPSGGAGGGSSRAVPPDDADLERTDGDGSGEFSAADEPGEGRAGTMDFPALGLTGATQDEIGESYCARYATEVCAARARCCIEMEDDCVGSTELDCGLNTSRELDGGNTFSSERVAAVFAALAQASSNCGSYQGPRDTDPFAIRFIPDGGDCDTIEERFGNQQCEGPLHCLDFVCGTPAAAGEPCSSNFNDLVCEDGYYCGPGSICLPLQQEGGECGGSVGCLEEAGLVCASNPVGTDPESVCAAPRPDGEYCQLFDDCASGFCTGQVCTACSTPSDCGDTPCTDGVCVGVFDSCDPFTSYGR